MNKKKKRRVVFLSIMGFILLLFMASAKYTSHSKFCSVCHYMKPFYQSWESSSHSHIECNACHYPPGLKSKFRAKIEGLLQVGRYWTKLYLKSKPWAEIPDESCLRPGCHDKRLLEGRVKFQRVVFDHKIHFSDLKRGKRLRCTSCHSQIVQGEHITVTESSCFICHFKKSEHYPQISDCSHCHHKEELTSEKTSRFNHTPVFDNGFNCDKCHSQVIIGDGEVPRENCYKCHWEKDRLDKYEDTDLMHTTHISSHKIECSQCHLEIQHKIVKDIETIANCKACHTGSHQPQKILFAGEGGKGVAHPMPNIMLEKGLSCKGCHIFHEEKGGRLVKSETSVAQAKACESCHGQGFARILKGWETATEKKLAAIKNIYKIATAEVGQSKSFKKKNAEFLLEEAAFNVDIVEKGKSVHNMAYSQALLIASLTKIEEALSLVGSPYRPDETSFQTQELQNQCVSCHAGIEEINARVFGLNFPHKSHLIAQKIRCETCHSNARKHGEFIATKHVCAICHHQETNKDCTSCHLLQKTLYEGGSSAGLNIPKDIMAEADVDCVACHQDKQNRIIRPDDRKCVECHGEGYRKIFQEWQDSVKNLLAELKASMKEIKKENLFEEQKIKSFSKPGEK